MGGRRTWWWGGALAVLLLVAGLVAYGLVRDEPYVAGPPRSSAAQPDPGGAAHALKALAQAVSAGDAAAAAAVAPPSDRTARDLLAALAVNADRLRVADLTMRYVDAVGTADADGRWEAAVDMTWRFDGFDRDPVHEEVLVQFQARAGAAVGVISVGGGDRRTPVWLTGPVEVRRTDRTLVLATSAEEADLLARRADAAVPVVRSVLPRWRGRLVVEVPADEAGLDAALAAEPGSYADIAAVSASVDGTLTPGAQVHVFVNPEVYDGLDPVGGQVVISHEATHVATGAPLTSELPLWLLEGFADYVALRDVDLPLTTTAGQIIEQVRKDGPPDHLPAQPEFDQSSSHLGAAYESAWLACRLLADLGGERALLRLYEEVSGGRGLDERLRALFGLDERGLTARWRQRLQALAAAATGSA